MIELCKPQISSKNQVDFHLPRSPIGVNPTSLKNRKFILSRKAANINNKFLRLATAIFRLRPKARSRKL